MKVSKDDIAKLQGYSDRIDEVVQAKKKDKKKIIAQLVEIANSYCDEAQQLAQEITSLKSAREKEVQKLKSEQEKQIQQLKS